MLLFKQTHTKKGQNIHKTEYVPKGFFFYWEKVLTECEISCPPSNKSRNAMTHSPRIPFATWEKCRVWGAVAKDNIPPVSRLVE